MKPILALPIIALGLSGCMTNLSLSGGGNDTRPSFDPTIPEKEVAWNEARVAKDPNGAIGWSQLAAAYLRMARLHDDNEYAVKAENAARKSLSIRRYNNANAAGRLTQSVLEQHRFTEALADAAEAVRIAAGDPAPHQIHAEILTELGRYDEARKELAGSGAKGLGAAALEARLDQIYGDTAHAIKIMASICKLVDANWDMAPEGKSWFHMKYATLLWDAGKTEEAKLEFEAAIEANPLDFKSMAFLARLQATQGDLAEGKRMALASVAITPTVDAASLLEDISTLQGNKDDEEKYRTMVDKVSHPDLYRFLANPTMVGNPAKPHTHDRLYAMYLADHGRNLPDALAAAEKDMASRQDIYAYDTLAWVLHQSGRDKEARAAVAKALAFGTKDAKMLFHAGMIDSSLGDSALSETELSAALALNPAFQFGQVEVARHELARIKAAEAK